MIRRSRVVPGPWFLLSVAAVCLVAATASRAGAAVLAEWDFSEASGTAANSSVGGWTGTLVNFPDTSAGAGDVPGVAGWTSDGRLNFDRETGQPGAARVETNFPLSSLIGSSFTVEFTGTHNNGAQGWSPFIGQSGAQSQVFFLGKQSGAQQLHYNFAGIGSATSHAVPIADGQEHRLAVVFDDAANTVWMYFDGNPVGKTTALTGTLTAGDYLWLGSVAHQPVNESWNGFADNVRISDVALTRDQLMGAAAPPPVKPLLAVSNRFNSVPNTTPGGVREDATALLSDRVADKWDNNAGYDTWDTANPDTDFTGMLYPGLLFFDTVTVQMGNQFPDGGHWAEAPKLYLLTDLIDTNNADRTPSNPASLTRPENSAHWVEVTGARLIAPGAFAADKTGDLDNSPITFDLSGLPLASRRAYGFAVGGVPGDGSSSFISVSELEFTATYYDKLTPLVPTSVVATNYNSVPGGNTRANALAVSTDGTLIDNSSGGLGWDTWISGGAPGSDFVGLLYGQQVRMDRLMVYLGNQFGDGGAWSEQPKVYILKNLVDTDTLAPETNPNWEEVPASLISFNVFDAAADVAGGGALSPYSLVVFDLAGLPIADRTGFGWAIGGVEGDGAARFLSIAEMQAFMVDPLRVPEPGTVALLALGGLGLVSLGWRTRRRRASA